MSNQALDQEVFWEEMKGLLEEAGSIDPQKPVSNEGVLGYLLIFAPEKEQPEEKGIFNLLAIFSPKRQVTICNGLDQRWFVLVSSNSGHFAALTNQRGRCWVQLPPGQYMPSLLTRVEYRERYGEPKAQETPDDPETEQIVDGLKQLADAERAQGTGTPWRPHGFRGQV